MNRQTRRKRSGAKIFALSPPCVWHFICLYVCLSSWSDWNNLGKNENIFVKRWTGSPLEERCVCYISLRVRSAGVIRFCPQITRRGTSTQFVTKIYISPVVCRSIQPSGDPPVRNQRWFTYVLLKEKLRQRRPSQRIVWCWIRTCNSYWTACIKN